MKTEEEIEQIAEELNRLIHDEVKKTQSVGFWFGSIHLRKWLMTKFDKEIDKVSDICFNCGQRMKELK
jgi:hypothetical protein